MLVTRQNFDEALSQLKVERAPKLVVDAETTGTAPFLGDHANGWAVKLGDFKAYFSVDHVQTDNITTEQYARLLDKFCAFPLIVNHNVGFDENFAFCDFQRTGHRARPWQTTRDTMCGVALWDENNPKGLKDFCDRWLRQGSSDERHNVELLLLQEKLKINEMGKLPAEKVAPYAIRDVELADELDDWLLARLYKPSLYHEYSAFAQLLTEMTRKGIPVDLEENARLDAEAAVHTEEALALIRTVSGVAHFNPNSPVHVRTWLRTKNAEEETLLACRNPDGSLKEEAELILEWKAWNRARQLFKVFAKSTVHGRLHGTFKATGTVAGRISHADPNLGAMPTNKKGHKAGKQRNKSAVVAPPGFVLIEADYSQAEPRTLAHFSGSAALKRIFEEGRDLHDEVAKMCGVPRQIGKTINMALLYGMGPKTMAQKLGIRHATAEAYMATYFEKFPGVKELLQAGISAARRDGFIVLGDGRRRHYNGTTALEKDAIPNKVQGRVAIMVRRVMLRLARELPEFDMLVQVHDSLLGLVREEDVAYVLPKLREIMEDQPWCTVPHRVDVKMGPTWGDMEEVAR